MSPEEFAARLRGIPGRLKSVDHSEALGACSEVVHASIGGNYQRQTDAKGNRWPERKDKKPHPLLILTRRMIIASLGGDGSIHVLSAKQMRMGVSTEVKYAAIQNAGGGRVPARQYYYVHSSDRPALRKVFFDRVRPNVRKVI